MFSQRGPEHWTNAVSENQIWYDQVLMRKYKSTVRIVSFEIELLSKFFIGKTAYEKRAQRDRTTMAGETFTVNIKRLVCKLKSIYLRDFEAL